MRTNASRLQCNHLQSHRGKGAISVRSVLVVMGCSASRSVAMGTEPTAATRDNFFDSSFKRRAAELQPALQVDHERTTAVIDLSMALALQAAQGDSTEAHLLEFAVSNSKAICDRMSIWMVNFSSSGLVCVASNAMGLTSRYLDLNDQSQMPCFAFVSSCNVRQRGDMQYPLRSFDPQVFDPPTKAALADIESRYGLAVRSAAFAPIVASPSESAPDVLRGVIELVYLKSNNSSTVTVAADEAPDDRFSSVEVSLMCQLSDSVGAALESLRLSNEVEAHQSSRLLNRILPRHIVSKLMEGNEEIIYESCENAFVLYSDIVSFTAWCSTREPREVLVLLNAMCAGVFCSRTCAVVRQAIAFDATLVPTLSLPPHSTQLKETPGAPYAPI